MDTSNNTAAIFKLHIMINLNIGQYNKLLQRVLLWDLTLVIIIIEKMHKKDSDQIVHLAADKSKW